MFMGVFLLWRPLLQIAIRWLILTETPKHCRNTEWLPKQASCTPKCVLRYFSPAFPNPPKGVLVLDWRIYVRFVFSGQHTAGIRCWTRSAPRVVMAAPLRPAKRSVAGYPPARFTACASRGRLATQFLAMHVKPEHPGLAVQTPRTLQVLATFCAVVLRLSQNQPAVPIVRHKRDVWLGHGLIAGLLEHACTAYRQ